jgi:hypothetical protein
MSFYTHRLIVAAAAAAASGALVAQAERELFATTDAQAELIERIAELRAAEGPTPAGIIDPLRDLASLYESADIHALAIVALEEARYVTRVHQGLTSADEAVLLHQQIRNEKALGNEQDVWDLQQDLVTLARQHHDDIRMLPIFRELAEDRSDALALYRAGSMPPEVYLGCYYVRDWRPYDDKRGEIHPPVGGQPDGVGCRSGQSTSVVVRLQAEILEYYADAIEVMLRNGDYASLELRDLEKQMFRASQAAGVSMFGYGRPIYGYRASDVGCRSGGQRIPVWALDDLVDLELLRSCLRPVIRDGSGTPVAANTQEWLNLVRLVSYETRSGAPPAARSKAIAELADWLLQSTPPERRRYEESDERALELYERAYRELARDEPARTSIFSPDVPVLLPTYEPNPFASSRMAESSRYIDVAFAVTKQGYGEQIEILATSQGATREEKRDLIRLIERRIFRPRFVDGQLADSAPVVVRYDLGP